VEVAPPFSRRWGFAIALRPPFARKPGLGLKTLSFDGVILNGLKAVKDLARIGSGLTLEMLASPLPTHARSFTRLKPGSG
jgi:hypothetical protein